MGRHSSADRYKELRQVRGGAGDAHAANDRERGASVVSRGASRTAAQESSGRSRSLEPRTAHLLEERLRRRARIKKAAFIAGGLIGVILVACTVAGFVYVKNIERSMQGTPESRTKLKQALTEAEPMKPFNVLMLGVDYRAGETQYRSDTMMLAHINPKTKEIWMLSIPRDTRVEIPGHGAHKINEAHFYDGPEGAIAAVEELTGLKINHYLEVNFRGFQKAVDALGGVWIDVPVAIDDWQADASPGHRASKIPAGYQLLDGWHALTFVRARHQFVDQDFSRMEHQQLFLRAMLSQLSKAGNIAKVPAVVSSIAKYVLTDMSAVDMLKTVQSLTGGSADRLYAATAKGEWKSPFIYTDTALLAKLVADIKAERSFDSTLPAGTAKQPAEITVTVRNGAGITGVAKRAADVLKAAGFNVGEVGNVKQGTYAKTLVVYKEDKGAAELVAKQLPSGTEVVASAGRYSYATEILVVVGSDWDPGKTMSTSGGN
jgi:LCP family protein required for cell wall assembly